MFAKRDWITIGLILLAQVGLGLCYWAVVSQRNVPPLPSKYAHATQAEKKEPKQGNQQVLVRNDPHVIQANHQEKSPALLPLPGESLPALKDSVHQAKDANIPLPAPDELPSAETPPALKSVSDKAEEIDIIPVTPAPPKMETAKASPDVPASPAEVPATAPPVPPAPNAPAKTDTKETPSSESPVPSQPRTSNNPAPPSVASVPSLPEDEVKHPPLPPNPATNISDPPVTKTLLAPPPPVEKRDAGETAVPPESPALPPTPPTVSNSEPDPEPIKKIAVKPAAPPPGPCSWKLRMEIVNGRTHLTARTEKGVEFLIRCDRLQLQRPFGNIEASGNVDITGKDFEGQCEHLTINWTQDQLQLHGGAHVHSCAGGQVMDTHGDQLRLRLSKK